LSVAQRRSAVALLLAFALIVPVACGHESGSGTTPQRLSAAEESIVASSQTSLRGYCQKFALYLAGRRGAPTSSETEQVDDDLERLIGLAGKKPDARARNGETMRLVLADMAEDLEGSNCSGGFEQKLDRALGTLPPEK
jgi:hypothetical protein